MNRNKKANMKRKCIVDPPNSMEEKKKTKQEDRVVCRVGEDVLVSEILSKLPVKSLMRFKCVSTHWQSLVQDKSFIDLYSSPSICFLITGTQQDTNYRRVLYSAELQLPSVVDGGIIGGGATCSKLKDPFARQNPICALNGLVCFTDTRRHCFRVYNSNTRETTPWIKSAIKQKEDEKRQQRKYKSCLTLLGHEFGYVSATKEYKVIALWDLYCPHLDTGDSDDSGSRIVCEVLNVRQNSWREIDDVPRIAPPQEIVSSVYVNGSIYFLHLAGYNEPYYLYEFNVANKKFSPVETHPDFDVDDTFNYSARLMEVDCQLTMFFQCVTSKSVDMYILYGGSIDDQNVQDNDTSSAASTDYAVSTSTGYCYWSLKTFSLPFHIWNGSFRQIPRTDLFIIGFYDNFSFYFYNRNTESLSSSKIEIHDLSSSLRGNPLHKVNFYVYTPNLLPVN